MNGVVIGALMALGMVQQQTDTTLAVDGATLLDVESLAGTVVVSVWDRNEVRIQAEHSRRTYVDVDHRGSRISVEPEADRGPASRASFRITMPASMDLKVEGYMVSITVDGVMGNVEAETLEGDVTVRGGRGTIKVSSMSGLVLIEDADGDIDVESAARDVRIVNSAGRITGETMGGNLVLQNVRATSVDVGSVGGQIWYDGTFAPRGTYFFGSHGGAVTLVVPGGTSAQFDLSTVHGTIRDNLDGEMRTADPRDVHTLEVGGGGAIVEAETFGGRISVVRKGTEGAIPDRRRDGAGMAMRGLEGLGHVVSTNVAVALAADWDFDWDPEWDRDWGGAWSAEWAAEWGSEWASEWGSEWAAEWSDGWAEHFESRFDGRSEEWGSGRREGRGGVR